MENQQNLLVFLVLKKEDFINSFAVMNADRFGGLKNSKKIIHQIE